MRNISKYTASLVALSALLTGCSLIIEPDKKQCKDNGDCSEPYVCGGAGICQIQTGCDQDSDCRAPGICVEKTCVTPECAKSSECEDGQYCNTGNGRCVAANKARCTEKEDCALYDGAPVCIKSEGLCGDAECTKAADCAELSPTAVCKDGACDDPTWGCLGVKDPRPAMNMSAPATFKVKVLYAYAQGGATETGVSDLRVRVCPTGDQQCLNESTKDISYGEDNYLVIRGLEAGRDYRVRLQANFPQDSSTPLIDGEFLMYRTVVGETVEPKPILMIDEKTRDEIAGYTKVNVDPNLGIMLTRIFDCSGIEVEGVSLNLAMPTTGCMGNCPTTIFYQNTSNIPQPGATATSVAGRVGVVNLRTDSFDRVTLTRTKDNKKILSFNVVGRPKTITYVHFYPWDFGTAVE